VRTGQTHSSPEKVTKPDSARLPLDGVLIGDCIDHMNGLPEASVDLVFADPPYNLQLKDTLYRPDQTTVEAVTDKWDKFDDYNAYDKFSIKWLTECKRILKTRRHDVDFASQT